MIYITFVVTHVHQFVKLRIRKQLNVKKNILYHLSLILPFIFLIICLLSACRFEQKIGYQQIKGQTMGTYYLLTYLDSKQINHQTAVDSLLKTLNQSLSTYIPTSTISKINQSQKGKFATDSHFINVFKRAKKIQQSTKGAFEPTIMPLVNAWNFGYKKTEQIDSTQIDSLLQLIDFNSLTLTNTNELHKKKAGVQLDFSAIAKGYGVDEIARFFHQKGIHNYLIDIGGELRAKGVNNQQMPWQIGIDRPVDSLKTRVPQAIVALHNQAVATSGNYRNYRIENGQKYAHIINPKTGYSELSNLLSASIFAPDCITADAYATASMVMGFEHAKQLIEQHKNLDALFIYSTQNGQLAVYATNGVNFALNRE